MRIKKVGLFILVFGLILISCKQKNKLKSNSVNQIKEFVEDKELKKSIDTNEIKNLIRQVLIWGESNNSIELLPVTSDVNNIIYTGFDKKKLKNNNVQLYNSGLFSKKFIESYNQIILSLDEKFKNNKFENETWYVGDLPPFDFVSGTNPWCKCQDNMDWNLIEIEYIKGNQFQWKWGGIKVETNNDWKKFRYKFNVIQENSKWKISYLEGFNINNLTK